MVVDSLVIAVDEDGNVYGIDPANGEPKWKTPTVLETSVLADMYVFENEVLVITRDEKLHAIDPEDGQSRLVGVTQ